MACLDSQLTKVLVGSKCLLLIRIPMYVRLCTYNEP